MPTIVLSPVCGSQTIKQSVWIPTRFFKVFRRQSHTVNRLLWIVPIGFKLYEFQRGTPAGFGENRREA
ncbi:MAG TPA: hypothetical protein VKB79_01405 [Bryobacteraceae bacterium]|nr:hypothetical protein [Bryobacteraceae bacterium]